MSTLSVVINVCNEAALLPECLASVRWADEIIVVDMQSTDNSAEIARAFGALVYSHPWEPIADRAHNFGFDKASKDWVLLLAPDERIPESLASQIVRICAEDTEFVAFRIPFKDYIFGKWIRFTGWQGNREIGLVRLFRRGKLRWVPEVHSQPIVDGKIGTIVYDPALDNAVVHLNYTSVSQFMEKLNRYTTAEAEKDLRAGRTFRWTKLLYHPLLAFWQRYVLGKGYKDGMHGFVLSILMAIYSEVTLIKMWEMKRVQGGS